MIYLVPFAAEHFDELIGWFSTEAELVQWAGPTFDFPLDRRQLEGMLSETRSEPPERLVWAALAEDGRMVGHVQVAIEHRSGVGRLARVGVKPAERGHGFALAMLERAVDFAFAMPGMERLELNVYTFNAPAIRTYEKLGFSSEGIRRSSARVGTERWDTLMMGLLKGEHEARLETAGASRRL